MKLDNVDRKLLYLLDQNCRQSTTQLSKQLQIHRNVVLYRIKRLEESQVIRGYYTDFNIGKLGYTTFRVLLQLSNYSDEDEKNLTNYLINITQLIWFFKTNGAYDMDIVFVSKTIREFHSFIEQLCVEFNRIIVKKNISTLVALSYYGKDYLITKKRGIPQKEETNNNCVDLDEADKQIIELLSNNGKISIVNIASKVNLSINTIKDRIKKLEKHKIILGYRPFIDTEKTGHSYYKLFMNLRNYSLSELTNLKSYFELKNHTIFITKYLNGADLEIEMHLEDEAQLLKLKSELISRFGRIIEQLYELKFVKEYVYRYLPMKI